MAAKRAAPQSDAPVTPVNYSARDHEVRAKEHHPDTYVPGVLRRGKGWCYSCAAWVPRSGCTPYQEHRAAVTAERARQAQLRALGLKGPRR